jgi:hypothetical protein
VRATFGAGLLAVCILAPSSEAVGASVTADLRNSGDFDKLGMDGTTSVYAYSKQGDVVNDDVRRDCEKQTGSRSGL